MHYHLCRYCYLGHALNYIVLHDDLRSGISRRDTSHRQRRRGSLGLVFGRLATGSHCCCGKHFHGRGKWLSYILMVC